MERYEILPHTADLRLKAVGDKLPQLFSAALAGMAEILKEGSSTLRGNIKENLSVSSADETTLLVDFLSEVLTIAYERGVVFTKANFSNFADNSLTAKLSGVEVDAFDEDIKAVTYHEVEVKKNKKGNYEATIIFDI